MTVTDQTVIRLVSEHTQILRELRDITKDHEKRLRIIERVIMGVLAVISFVQFVLKH